MKCLMILTAFTSLFLDSLSSQSYGSQQSIERDIERVGPDAEAALPLFQKAYAAHANKELSHHYLAGIETAEKLVRIAQNNPDHATPCRELPDLINQCLSAQYSYDDISDLMSWNDYKAFMINFAAWKSDIDKTANHHYTTHVDLTYTENYGPITDKVYPGFIPTPTGRIGKTTILLCLAHRVAPFGFPLSFENIKKDTRETDTNGFINHDHSYHFNVYGTEQKRDWVLSSRFHEFLEKIPFTDDVMNFFFHKVWEDLQMTLSSVSRTLTITALDTYNAQSKFMTTVAPYLGEFYVSLYGHNPFHDTEILKKNIISFMEYHLNWEDLPKIFQHFSTSGDVLAVLNGTKPLCNRSPLLQKIDALGFSSFLQKKKAMGYRNESELKSIFYEEIDHFIHFVLFFNKLTPEQLMHIEAAHENGYFKTLEVEIVMKSLYVEKHMPGYVIPQSHTLYTVQGILEKIMNSRNSRSVV